MNAFELLLKIKESTHAWTAGFPLMNSASFPDRDVARDIYKLCNEYDALNNKPMNEDMKRADCFPLSELKSQKTMKTTCPNCGCKFAETVLSESGDEPNSLEERFRRVCKERNAMKEVLDSLFRETFNQGSTEGVYNIILEYFQHKPPTYRPQNEVSASKAG